MVEASTEFALWQIPDVRSSPCLLPAIRQLQIWQVSASVKSSPEKAKLFIADKPVVIGEFGAQLPMADRIGIYQAIYDEILDAATDGLPCSR